MPLVQKGLMDLIMYTWVDGAYPSEPQHMHVKVWDPINLPSLKEDVASTFSYNEWELPRAFFDVMTHLTLHVVEELDICAPIHTHWMYPIK